MGKAMHGEFAATAKITLLVDKATVIGSCKGNPAKLYDLLEDGETVESYMAKIRPLKGTLCELRKGLHKKWLTVEGVDPAAYEKVHGTLYHAGEHPNGGPVPRKPKVTFAELATAAALYATAMNMKAPKAK